MSITKVNSFMEAGINYVLAGLAMAEDGPTHRAATPRVYVACGEQACSKTITIFDDGSQHRQRRGVSLATLEHGAPVYLTPCDAHGGETFPSTEDLQANALRDKP